MNNILLISLGNIECLIEANQCDILRLKADVSSFLMTLLSTVFLTILNFFALLSLFREFSMSKGNLF